MEVYTMEQWNLDKEFKAQIGQEVSDEVFEEMRDCVPPAYYSQGIMQVGEPYDADAETYENLYATFVRTDNGWKYVGHCLRGRTENRKGYCDSMR